MAPPDPRLAKMAEIFKIVQDSVTKEELVMALEAMKKKVDSVGVNNDKDFELMKGAIDALSKKIDAQLESKMLAVDEKLGEVKDGENAKPEDVVPLVLAALPPDVEETAEETKNKLESLKGENRLDKSAVKGIEEIEKEVKEISVRPSGRGGGGGKGFTLYVGGAKKLLTAQTLNLVAGTGITLSYNYANGRNDVTITSSSTGGQILAATGTVNGTNLSFTFTSAPTQLVIDGVAKQKTQSDGTVNWTGTTSITLTGAQAPNFDIYGIS
jgi:hypothetical protein